MSNEYAVMPMSDYVSACDTIKNKIGTGNNHILSGDLPKKINEVFEAGKQEILSNVMDVSEDWQITFWIDSWEFTAIKGMTWFEWCQTENSYYDIDYNYKFDCGGNDEYVMAESIEVCSPNSGPVLGRHIIIPNTHYTW